MTQSALDTDQSARKRQAIGLPARRETAQGQVYRPPTIRNESRTQQWLLVLFMAMFAVSTTLLVAAKFIGAPTDWQSVQSALLSFWASPVQGATAFVRVEDDFASEQSVLVRDFEYGRWSMGVVPEDGVYLFRLRPGTVAWSTLGLNAITNFRAATSLIIAPETPQGYGGIVARYSDDANLYMVEIDGLGRYRIQAEKEGAWATLRDWTADAAIAPAGQPNELMVEDDGSLVRYFANDRLLFEADAVGLPPGDVGIMAGSVDSLITEVAFDWLEVEPLGK